MAIGIFGLPQAGKTTIFDAATGGSAKAARSGRGPSVGVVRVPDPRVERLAEIDHPQRIIHAEIEYLDVPAPSGSGEKAKGIGAEYLNVLGTCEALLMVCRAFEDPAVAHVEGSVDPYRDAATLELELVLSDLGVLERRDERIDGQLRTAKALDRDALRKEQTLIASMRTALEAETPVRQQHLPPAAAPLLQNFGLLSAKPLMVIFNIDEDDVGRTAEIEAEMAERLGPSAATAAVSGKLETELAEMSPEDEAEFRVSLGAGEPGLDRTAVLCYGVLGLIAFLTMGPDEARAWAIRRGTTALEAAGKVHTDIQRGFIRAEVVAFDDLVRAGSLPEARKQATLRSEGKGYVMRDGDVVNFLFNV